MNVLLEYFQLIYCLISMHLIVIVLLEHIELLSLHHINVFLQNIFIRIVTQLGVDMHTMPTACYHAGIFLTQVYSCSLPYQLLK